MRITNTGLLFDDAAQSTPGYMLFSPVDSDLTVLLRPDGSDAHQWRTGNGMTNWTYLRPNGNLWEWHFTDHLADRYALYPNSNRWSYGHTNTVCPLDDGSYLISSKNLCLVFILHPEKGILWEYQNDEMSGQHDAQLLDNGNVLVFANGVYQSDLHHSQVFEIDRESKDIVWR